MKDEFYICNTTFKLNICNISKIFRLNTNKLDRIVDFDNRIIIKLSKSKGRLKLCNTSNKIIGVDVIPYLKSNYEFMDQIMRVISIIKDNYVPISFDYSDIIPSQGIINNTNYHSDLNIILKWTYSGNWKDANKLLITIF